MHLGFPWCRKAERMVRNIDPHYAQCSGCAERAQLLYGRLGCRVCTWILWSSLVLQALCPSTVGRIYLPSVLFSLGDS